MYFVDGRIDPDGRETDVRAKRYSREHNCDYATALHAVVRGEQVRQRAYAQENGQGQVGDIQLLGATIASLPKLDDGSPNVNLVLETLNASETFRSLATSAAGEFLDHQAQQLFSSAKAHEGITLQECMRVAQRDNPSVASLYNGGKVTEPALKTIWWTIFRYASGSGVRKYSSSHISYDSAGNEIRRYDLAVTR